jgi:thymidylate kinase
MTPTQVNPERENQVNGREGPSAARMAVDRSEPDFLRALFRALDDHEVRYCVLHSWEELPDHLPSDLDVAVHPRDHAELAAVFGALREQGFLPVQCLNYAVNACYFVFNWFHGTTFKTAAVDVIFEHRRGGLILMSGEDLVEGRIRRGLLWAPAPAIELHYLLAKKTLKKSVSPHQENRIKDLVSELGRNRAEKVAADLFGKKRAKRVVDACLNGSLPPTLIQITGSLRRTAILHDPFGPVRNCFGDSVRRIRRWLQPTGMFLVILGPDGVGKSTLVGQLVEKLGPAFRRHKVFHFRPQLIKPEVETGLPATDPHGDPVRGTVGSVSRLAGLFVDFWAGHIAVTRPLLARSGLVIFDRYFHDIMIDSRRYRYGGPLWLVRFLARFVPPPDLLFLVLDAELDVILSRKREVAPELLMRLRASYANLAQNSLHAELIKTDGGIEKTLAAALRIISFCLAERFDRRHASWLATDNSVARDCKAEEVTQP